MLDQTSQIADGYGLNLFFPVMVLLLLRCFDIRWLARPFPDTKGIKNSRRYRIFPETIVFEPYCSVENVFSGGHNIP